MQRRLAKRICLETAFYDRELGETISLIDAIHVIECLQNMPILDPTVGIAAHAIPPVFPGLVLADGYGRGAFQQYDRPS